MYYTKEKLEVPILQHKWNEFSICILNVFHYHSIYILYQYGLHPILYSNWLRQAKWYWNTVYVHVKRIKPNITFASFFLSNKHCYKCGSNMCVLSGRAMYYYLLTYFENYFWYINIKSHLFHTNTGSSPIGMHHMLLYYV